MLASVLLLAAAAIAAPTTGDFNSIQTKDGDLCLSSGGRFDQGAPLKLAPCSTCEKDQRFKWEPFTFQGAEAGVEYFTIHSQGGLCVVSHVPCTSASFFHSSATNSRPRLLLRSACSGSLRLRRGLSQPQLMAPHVGQGRRQNLHVAQEGGRHLRPRAKRTLLLSQGLYRWRRDRSRYRRDWQAHRLEVVSRHATDTPL